MKSYLFALEAGLLVGIVHSLMNVHSPTLPVIAIIGLLGMLGGGQIMPIAKPAEKASHWAGLIRSAATRVRRAPFAPRLSLTSVTFRASRKFHAAVRAPALSPLALAERLIEEKAALGESHARRCHLQSSRSQPPASNSEACGGAEQIEPRKVDQQPSPMPKTNFLE